MSSNSDHEELNIEFKSHAHDSDDDHDKGRRQSPLSAHRDQYQSQLASSAMPAYQQGASSSGSPNVGALVDVHSSAETEQSEISETDQPKHLANCDVTVSETETETNTIQNDPNDVESSSPSINQSATASSSLSLLGAYPPQWLPDNETDSCMSCDCLFTLIKRRHHCRSCGKIFCSDCCRNKAKLLYLNLKEARVCANCLYILEQTHTDISTGSVDNQSTGLGLNIDTVNNHRMGQPHSALTNHNNTDSPSSQSCETDRNERYHQSVSSATSPDQPKIRGVLKNGNHSRSATSTIEGPISLSPTCSSSDVQQDAQQPDKQVIFSDGIRPGTDLTEPFTYPISSVASGATSVQMTFPILARQTKLRSDPSNHSNSDKMSRGHKSTSSSSCCSSACSSNSNSRTMTVCDDLGYLPPVVINKDSKILKGAGSSTGNQSAVSSLSSLIMSQFKLIDAGKSVKAYLESSGSTLNGSVKFKDLAESTGSDGIVDFILLRDYFLRVKIVTRDSRENGSCPFQSKHRVSEENSLPDMESQSPQEFWCFLSDGLSRFGQQEVLMVLDKNTEDSCLPRDVFKIFVTLHELALRRQTINDLGNLLFHDGLFGNRDNAGIVFVRPLESHRLDNLIIPDKPFIVALVLQRCEIPWSKVFPVRLLLRLGHKYNTYPYPLVSYKSREPVYYEVGHTIISILGDFRNFRYSLTHVDGLRVMINKSTKRIVIQLDESSYQQFNKVLDASNNEHVLAWSAYPFLDADGHMVCIQNEEGHYETTEFFKDASNFAHYEGCPNESDPGNIIGASFVIFSGALKANQSGQPAKISIVEDGLLIQIQSCTMSALKNAIHFMHHFDIDCETDHDVLNRVEINWLK